MSDGELSQTNNDSDSNFLFFPHRCLGNSEINKHKTDKSKGKKYIFVVQTTRNTVNYSSRTSSGDKSVASYSVNYEKIRLYFHLPEKRFSGKKLIHPCKTLVDSSRFE